MTETTADKLPAERPMDEYGDPDMMSEQSALMIQQAAEHYENKLRDFANGHNTIFAIEDVLSILELDQDRDATRFTIPSIAKALLNLGCTTEKMIVFIPPSRIPAGEIAG